MDDASELLPLTPVLDQIVTFDTQMYICNLKEDPISSLLSSLDRVP